MQQQLPLRLRGATTSLENGKFQMFVMAFLESVQPFKGSSMQALSPAAETLRSQVHYVGEATLSVGEQKLPLDTLAVTAIFTSTERVGGIFGDPRQ